MLHARSAGCKIEACSFGRSASSLLRETVSIFYDLDKEKDKYLIKSNRPPQRSIPRKPASRSKSGVRVIK